MENDDSMLDSGVRKLKGFHLNRRAVLKGAMASGAALLSAPAVLRAAAQDEIQVASMFDLTGNLNIYGVQQMNVSKYAIEAINEAGGVLGKKLVLNA